MQVCNSLQTDNHASTPPLTFFTDWMPFLPPNQQCQSSKLVSSKLVTYVTVKVQLRKSVAVYVKYWLYFTGPTNIILLSESDFKITRNYKDCNACSNA